MGGKGRAAGPEPYVGMSPTQEFNARLSAASDFYTPDALRSPAATADPTSPADTVTAATPAASTASDNQLGASEVASPSGPGVGGESVTTTQDTGGQPTGDMMAQAMTAPAMWSDQMRRAQGPADGSLNVTGQV